MDKISNNKHDQTYADDEYDGEGCYTDQYWDDSGEYENQIYDPTWDELPNYIGDGDKYYEEGCYLSQYWDDNGYYVDEWDDDDGEDENQTYDPTWDELPNYIVDDDEYYEEGCYLAQYWDNNGDCLDEWDDDGYYEDQWDDEDGEHENQTYDPTWDELPNYIGDDDDDDEYEYDSNSWEDDEQQHDREHESFDQGYCCFPVSHINKSHLEAGNRIIMPPSALRRLLSIHVEYPMLFEIKNTSSGRISHCGVLEFSADEGIVCMPAWLMKSMNLQEGALVSIKNIASLPKATYIKLQPHSTKFFRISDPKTVLETTLRDFSCVTKGDTITITHENNQYYIDIIETKPSDAICMIDTDCEVDFATPLDYKEPEKKPEAVFNWVSEPATDREEPKFKPFTGVSRRLDGAETATISMTMVKESGSRTATTSMVEENGFTADNGKFIFKPTKKSMMTPKEDVKVKEESLKKEAKNFQPFTGKKYTLGS